MVMVMKNEPRFEDRGWEQWVEEPPSRDCEGEDIVAVVEVVLKDVRAKKSYVVRRCIGEITRQIVTGGTPDETAPDLEDVKREMRRVANELENFVLIGVC